MTGKPAHDIRSTLTFPKTKISNGCKTQYLNDGYYYYLDINAACMNFIKSIVSNKDDGYVKSVIRFKEEYGEYPQ